MLGTSEFQMNSSSMQTRSEVILGSLWVRVISGTEIYLFLYATVVCITVGWAFHVCDGGRRFKSQTTQMTHIAFINPTHNYELYLEVVIGLKVIIIIGTVI